MAAPREASLPGLLAQLTEPDPGPAYRAVLDRGGLIYDDDADIWVLGNRSQVEVGLREHSVFSSAQGVGVERLPVPLLLSMDPPDHPRLRKAISREFTPAAVEKWRSLVADLSAEAISRIRERGGGNIVEEFAVPVPPAVIAAMMGLPYDDLPQLRRWAEAAIVALVPPQTPEQRELLWRDIAAMYGFFHQLVVSRAESPGDDLLSRLLDPDVASDVADFEVASFGILLLVAGHETTSNLVAALIARMARSPALWGQLRTDPAMISRAVDETLRLDPPIQGFFRTTTVAVSTDGVEIPSGAKVLLLFAAANRDPIWIEDPEEFRLDRGELAHFGFGYGIHHCLGMNLGRMEAITMVRELADAATRLTLSGEIEVGGHPLLRRFQRVPVSIER